MTDEQIDEIKKLITGTGELLKSLDPKTDEQWDAFQKLTAAHKQMRAIDLTHLVEFKHL
ncbi:MAG: hypothetical protein PHQ86_01820 [Dehalococcoidales bacterium]|nr:hypothetical protein [Dehalococcoidales bacterium]